MKKRIGGCIAAMVLLLALFSSGSLSWFHAEAEAQKVGQAGVIDLALDYDPDLQNGEGGFVLENTGTLDVHVRLGYTFQYVNDIREPLMYDVSPIGFENFHLERDGEPQLFRFDQLAHRAGGFEQEKDFLLPLSSEDRYLLLQPGEVLTADYQLKGIPADLTDRLQVIWVAEAIQTGEAALRDAADYGWDLTMA